MIRGVILFAAVTLVAALSFGATIHVPSQQPTIQAGINAASTGDTVLVAPGTYVENVNFQQKSIVVASVGGRNVTTIQAANSAIETVRMVGTGSTWMKLSGFKVTGSGHSGVFADQSAAKITDNDITGNSSSGGNDGAGINLKSVSGATVRGNIIHGNVANTYGPGIHLGDDGLSISFDTIAYNVLYANTGHGDIRLLGYSNGIRIYNNTVSITTNEGIQEQTSGNVTAVNNIVFFSKSWAIFSAGSLSASYNCVYSSPSPYNFTPGPGNVYVDAQFVDTANHDYHLKSSSPCIDAGDPNAIFNDANGTRNDMGALPFDIGGPDVWIGVTHYPSIQAAIDAAIPNATVMVGKGTAYEHLTIGKPLILSSQFGADSTTIDGQNLIQDTSNSVITIINADSVTIQGFHIRGGRGIMGTDSTEARGGGIFLASSKLTLNSCLIKNNKVSERAINDNLMGGGGLFADIGSEICATKCSFVGNSVEESAFEQEIGTEAGGGILALTGRTRLIECEFANNQVWSPMVSAYGGGMAAWGDSVVVSKCRFSQNSVSNGQGMDHAQTEYAGGGLYIEGNAAVVDSIDCGDNSISIIGGNLSTIIGMGGALCIRGNFGRIFVIECSSNFIFGGNAVVRLYGGAISLLGTDFDLAGANLISNRIMGGGWDVGGESASSFGGAIYLSGSGTCRSGIVRNSRISSWSGDSFGGGLALEGNWQLTSTDCDSCAVVRANYYNGTSGMFQGGGAWMGPNCSVELSVISNCMLIDSCPNAGQFDAQGGGCYLFSSSAVANTNIWSNEPTNVVGGNWSPGTNGNISADPQFCFPDTGNFYLKASSPCAAGNHVSGQTVGAFDVGCYGADMVKSLGLADGGSLGNVVAQMPKYGWKAFYHPSYTQARFEIAVGTDNDWQYSEMWNPAPFNSSDTFVTYAGAPLVDGQTYYLRLRISDGVSWSNWYYTSFHMNTPPTAPVPYAPQWPNITVSTTPDLSVVNATDAENDTLAYDFEVYYDSMLTQLAVASPHVDETHNPDSTSWTVTPPLTDNKYYYWRARAFDGYEYSPWSSMRYFIADNANEPPNPFTLIDPPDSTGSILYNRKPTFHWTYTGDPDPYNQVRYKLELAVDPAFTFKQVIDSLYTSFWIPPDSLPYHSHHWWRVTAIDQYGATTLSPNVKEFWIWTLGDVDHSNNVDIADLSRLIDYLYISFGPIVPRKVGDLDGDCTVDIADLSRMIDYLYLSLIPLDVGGCGP